MYENKFDTIDNLKWYPYVGNFYNKQNINILIVGESHYVTGDELGQMINSKEYTKKVIEKWAMYLPDGAEKLDSNKLRALTKQPMFANLHRALGVDNNNSSKMWNNAAFYNFVQRPMVNGAKDRPTTKDFIDGWETFLGIRDILNPDYCIFVGVAAADYLNKSLQQKIGTIKIDYKKLDENQKRSKKSRIFKIDKTKCIAIQHTSHHFSYTKWNKFLNENFPELMDIIKSWSTLN